MNNFSLFCKIWILKFLWPLKAIEACFISHLRKIILDAVVVFFILIIGIYGAFFLFSNHLFFINFNMIQITFGASFILFFLYTFLNNLMQTLLDHSKTPNPILVTHQNHIELLSQIQKEKIHLENSLPRGKLKKFRKRI